MSEKRPRMKKAAQVTDLLTAILRGTPAEQRLKEGRIWLVWDEAVGDRIASHAQPAAFRNGVLTVHVDSAPWLQQLTYLKKELLTKVNEALEEEQVKEIHLKTGQIMKPPQSPQKPETHPLNDEEQALIKEQAGSVEDPDLRAVLENLIRRDREHHKG